MICPSHSNTPPPPPPSLHRPGMTLINRVSVWERLSKVIGGVCYLLGVMWPTVLNEQISPSSAMQQLMMIMMVPWLITGVCLLFPFPSLAAYAAQRKVESVCKKLNAALTATNAAFCATDYADLYTTHATHLLTNCEVTGLSVQSYSTLDTLCTDLPINRTFSQHTLSTYHTLFSTILLSS